MKKVILAIMVVLLVLAGAAGIYKIVNKSEPPAAATSAAQTNNQTKTDDATASTETVAGEATITYTDNGYSPATITVKSGTKVTVKNDSNRAMQFDSDPHPAHTGNRELNAENIAPGKSQTFIVTKVGTFGYHNHLNEDETGTIIVQ